MDISGTNLMIDHVSTLYATDETISMNEVANNITVQYSNISQGQNYPQWDAEGGGLTGHALGSLLEAGNVRYQAAISFHHNLYAHQKARVPQMQAGWHRRLLRFSQQRLLQLVWDRRQQKRDERSSILSTTSTWPATAAISPSAAQTPASRRKAAAPVC